jgi:hypothetical protein
VGKKDYGGSGLTIRAAMLDDGKRKRRASIVDNYILEALTVRVIFRP